MKTLFLITLLSLLSPSTQASVVLAKMTYQKDQRVLGLYQLTDIQLHGKKMVAWQKEILLKSILPHFVVAKKKWFWPFSQRQKTLSHTAVTTTITPIPSVSTSKGTTKLSFDPSQSQIILDNLQQQGFSFKKSKGLQLSLLCQAKKAIQICELKSEKPTVLALSKMK